VNVLDSEGTEIPVFHRPVLIVEALRRIFPEVPVNLMAASDHIQSIADLITMILPSCLYFSKVSIELITYDT